MRILVTGMSAQQANRESTKRGANFTGLVVRALEERGHQVDWRNPSVNETKGSLGRYDAVVVGVAPVTSLGANRAYGALSTIWHLWDDPRLTLLVDAPDPDKVASSLNAISKKPERLLKNFFSYRLEYTEACHDRNSRRLMDTVMMLKDDPWPMTIAPRLPWQQVNVIKGIPQTSGSAYNVYLTNLDRFVFEDAPPVPPRESKRHLVWAYETGTSHRWLRTQNVTWDTGSIAKNVRANADKVALEQLRQVAGCLIAPTRTGTWWSTRYAQALSQGAPVFSDWAETRTLGVQWEQLPSLAETWSFGQRAALHELQLQSYRDAIAVQDRVSELESVLTTRTA